MLDKSENSDEHEQVTTAKKSKPNLGKRLKKFTIYMLILAVFVPVFGRIVPKLLFAPEKPDISEDISLNEPQKSELLKIEPEKYLVAPIEKPLETAPLVALTPSAAPAIAPVPLPAPVPPPLTVPPNDPRLSTLENKVANLETEFSELKKQLEMQAVKTTDVTQNAENKVALITAFGQLREAVLHGENYIFQLNQLQKLLANNLEASALITKLTPNSEQEIIPTTELVKQFEPLAKQVMTSKNPSWVKNASQKFITIRRIGKQDGADDEAILARAEENLAGNSPALNKAIAELEKLSPPAKQIFSTWVANANKILETKDNLYQLQILLSKQATTPQPMP
jgi:hypothetical protein